MLYQQTIHPSQGKTLSFATVPLQPGTLILKEKPILAEKGWKNIIKHANKQEKKEWEELACTKGREWKKTDQRYAKWVGKWLMQRNHNNPEIKPTLDDAVTLLHICDTNAHEISQDTSTNPPDDSFVPYGDSKSLDSNLAVQHSEGVQAFASSDTSNRNFPTDNVIIHDQSADQRFIQEEVIDSSSHMPVIGNLKEDYDIEMNESQGSYSSAHDSEESDDVSVCSDEEESTLLYKMASLPSHSCLPNSFMHISPETQEAELRTIVSINNHCQITINYLDEEYLPRTYRRKMLAGRRGFDCTCDMCIGDSIPEYAEPGICTSCSNNGPTYRFHQRGVWICRACGHRSTSSHPVEEGVAFWETRWSNVENEVNDLWIEKLMHLLREFYADPRHGFGSLPSLPMKDFSAGGQIHISHSVIYNALRVLSTNGIIHTRWGAKTSWVVVCYLASVGNLIAEFLGDGSEECRWTCHWLLQHPEARRQRDNSDWYREASRRWQQAMRITRGLVYTQETADRIEN